MYIKILNNNDLSLTLNKTELKMIQGCRERLGGCCVFLDDQLAKKWFKQYDFKKGICDYCNLKTGCRYVFNSLKVLEKLADGQTVHIQAKEMIIGSYI